jgi:hypothetical protein
MQRLMVGNGLATWNNNNNHRLGCSLTPRGVLFFQVLSNQTTSPPAPAVPASQIQPVKDTIRQEDTGVGEGFTALPGENV